MTEGQKQLTKYFKPFVIWLQQVIPATKWFSLGVNEVDLVS